MQGPTSLSRSEGWSPLPGDIPRRSMMPRAVIDRTPHPVDPPGGAFGCGVGHAVARWESSRAHARARHAAADAAGDRRVSAIQPSPGLSLGQTLPLPPRPPRLRVRPHPAGRGRPRPYGNSPGPSCSSCSSCPPIRLSACPSHPIGEIWEGLSRRYPTRGHAEPRRNPVGRDR
jgi:hypothetical protein